MSFETGQDNESSVSSDAPSYTSPRQQIAMRVRRDPIAKIGGTIVAITIILTIFSIIDDFLLNEQLITTILHNPYALHPNARLQPPSLEYPMGTDAQGRAILARIIYGTRTSIIVGVGAVGFAVIVGVILGVSTAYYGGLFDSLGMRAMDVLLAFPAIVLALVLLASLGRGLVSISLAIGVAYVPSFARITRSKALSVKSNNYVKAAQVVGYPTRNILIDEILPNCFTPIVVQATFALAGAIIAEAGLSFLGLGVAPPTPTWGKMLSFAQRYIIEAWWYSLFPGLAIMITVLGFNLLGDSIRDALNPQGEIQGDQRR